MALSALIKDPNAMRPWYGPATRQHTRTELSLALATATLELVCAQADISLADSYTLQRLPTVVAIRMGYIAACYQWCIPIPVVASLLHRNYGSISYHHAHIGLYAEVGYRTRALAQQHLPISLVFALPEWLVPLPFIRDYWHPPLDAAFTALLPAYFQGKPHGQGVAIVAQKNASLRAWCMRAWCAMGNHTEARRLALFGDVAHIW